MAMSSVLYRSRRRGRRSGSKRKGAQWQRGESQWDTDSLSGIITGHSAQPQAKLSVSSPDEPAEKQADRMADQVVAGESVSRKCEECEEETQTKLMRVEEEEEPQAKLMRQPEEEEEPQAKLMREAEEEEEPQAKLMRQPEEEEPQTKLMRMEEEEQAQAKGEGVSSGSSSGGKRSAGSTPATGVSGRLQSRKGMGSPLSGSTLRTMEAGFGRDFSGVRIHTDTEAESLSRRLRAQAFTLGKDIYFNRGKYNPDTREGKHLLAHELTHVVQQNKSLNKKIQRQAAGGAACNPCPNPVGQAVRSRLYARLNFATLGGGFGLTRAPNVRITFVSLWHRERRNCNHCRDGRSHEWDLCPRRAVVLGTVPVDIDRDQIRRRGPGGQRWFIDCNNVFDVRHTTPAAAAATMGRPRRVTVRMTRIHEMHHVRFINDQMNAHLRARNDIHQICPYRSRDIANWKRNLENDWRNDAQTFTRGLGNTRAEETAARNHTC